MLLRIDHFAPILNAAIAALELELQRQLEIIDLAVFPNEKRVVLERHVFRMTNNRAIFHAPHPGVALPTVQIFAIEQLFGFLGGCRTRHEKQCDKCTNESAIHNRFLYMRIWIRSADHSRRWCTTSHKVNRRSALCKSRTILL